MLLVLLEHCARKMSRMDGRGAPMILQPCSLSAGGSCGQQHCSSIPDSDAAGQHTLNGAPVECGEDGWRETCSFQPAEKV